MVKSLFENTWNTRDIGGYPLKDGRVTRYDRIWRSGAPRLVTENDIALLRSHGITTDIDIRTVETAMEKPDPLKELPGMDYHLFPIDEGAYAPSSLAAVPCTYMDIAQAKHIAEVFHAIAAATGGVLLHCSAGKDRTGVICAILLLLCGAEDDVICRDYTVSREYNRENLELFLRDHPEVCREAVMATEISMVTFLEMFRERFHTAERYLKEIGLREDEINALRKRLTGSKNDAEMQE